MVSTPDVLNTSHGLSEKEARYKNTIPLDRVCNKQIWPNSLDWTEIRNVHNLTVSTINIQHYTNGILSTLQCLINAKCICIIVFCLGVFTNSCFVSSVAFTQGGAIQITNAAGEGVQGLQTLAMPPSGAPQTGPPMVAYSTQAGDGTPQYYLPANKMMVQGKHPFVHSSLTKVALHFRPWKRSADKCTFRLHFLGEY